MSSFEILLFWYMLTGSILLSTYCFYSAYNKAKLGEDYVNEVLIAVSSPLILYLSVGVLIVLPVVLVVLGIPFYLLSKVKRDKATTSKENKL